MRQSLARYSAPVSFVHAPSLADFITTIVGFKVFDTHSGLSRCPVAVLADIGFAGRAVGWILSYPGVALIALWLIWIKGPMAIERLDLATALQSMARSVLRCSLGPRSEAVSTTRMATCHLKPPLVQR